VTHKTHTHIHTPQGNIIIYSDRSEFLNEWLISLHFGFHQMLMMIQQFQNKFKGSGSGTTCKLEWTILIYISSICTCSSPRTILVLNKPIVIINRKQSKVKERGNSISRN